MELGLAPNCFPPMAASALLPSPAAGGQLEVSTAVLQESSAPC